MIREGEGFIAKWRRGRRERREKKLIEYWENIKALQDPVRGTRNILPPSPSEATTLPAWSAVRYDNAFSIPVDNEITASGTTFSFFHGSSQEGGADLIELPYTPIRLMASLNINEQVPGNTFEKQLNQMVEDYLKGTNTVGLWHDTGQNGNEGLGGWVNVPGMKGWKSYNAEILDQSSRIPYLQNMIGRSTCYEKKYDRIRSEAAGEPQIEINDFDTGPIDISVKRFSVKIRGEEIGYADLIDPHKGYKLKVLGWMYIKPEFQKKGYGVKLMKGVQDYIQESGRNNLGILQDPNNGSQNGSIKIYEENRWQTPNIDLLRRNNIIGLSPSNLEKITEFALFNYEKAIQRRMSIDNRQGKHTIEMESHRTSFPRH